MGGNTKKRKHHDSENQKRELLLRGDGLEYGQVSKILGNGRMEVNCFDGKVRMGHIRGKIYKRVWIGMGDVILVALRDFQDDKVDIINKYTTDEIKKLKNMGEIPSDTKIIQSQVAFSDMGGDDNIDIVFDEI